MSLTDGKPLNGGPAGQPIIVQSKSAFRFDLVALIVAVVAMAFAIYLMIDSKKAMKDAGDKIAALQKDVASNASKTERSMEMMQADFGVVQSKLGVTQAQLDEARETAQRLRAEQEKSVSQLNAKLSQKADNQQLSAFKDETSNKLGAVNADVTQVKSDVDATKKDLEGTRRDLVDVRETLTAAIARNHDELQQLRAKGDHNYYEFTLEKKKGASLVADVKLSVTKTDVKKKKFNMAIIVDDNTLEKKDRTVNEPVQFLVGRTKLRYEIVVNEVEKDKLVGYLSVPKDKGLAAERP